MHLFIGLQSTPLHLAAEKGHAEIISHFIDACAQLEAVERWNVSTWVVMGECAMCMHIKKACPARLQLTKACVKVTCLRFSCNHTFYLLCDPFPFEIKLFQFNSIQFWQLTAASFMHEYGLQSVC